MYADLAANSVPGIAGDRRVVGSGCDAGSGEWMVGAVLLRSQKQSPVAV